MVDERGGERVSQSHVLQRFHRRIMRGTVAQAESAAPNDRNGILVQALVQQVEQTFHLFNPLLVPDVAGGVLVWILFPIRLPERGSAQALRFA